MTWILCIKSFILFKSLGLLELVGIICWHMYLPGMMRLKKSIGSNAYRSWSLKFFSSLRSFLIFSSIIVQNWLKKLSNSNGLNCWGDHVLWLNNLAICPNHDCNIINCLESSLTVSWAPTTVAPPLFAGNYLQRESGSGLKSL